MEKYIGIKEIQAEPMIKDGVDGYKVVYPDKYVSHSPKKVFEDSYKKIHGEMREMEIFYPNEHTVVYHDENVFAAPHHYIIKNKNGNILTAINFQEGPLKENPLNGVFLEDLLNICIKRLVCHQESTYACNENEHALKDLQNAIYWLNKRKEDRIKRGVLGTQQL